MEYFRLAAKHCTATSQMYVHTSLKNTVWLALKQGMVVKSPSVYLKN